MKLKKQIINIVVFAILMVTIHTQIDFSEAQKNIVIYILITMVYLGLTIRPRLRSKP